MTIRQFKTLAALAVAAFVAGATLNIWPLLGRHSGEVADYSLVGCMVLVAFLAGAAAVGRGVDRLQAAYDEAVTEACVLHEGLSDLIEAISGGNPPKDSDALMEHLDALLDKAHAEAYRSEDEEVAA